METRSLSQLVTELAIPSLSNYVRVVRDFGHLLPVEIDPAVTEDIIEQLQKAVIMEED